MEQEKLVKKREDSKHIIYTSYEEYDKETAIKVPVFNIDSDNVKRNE